MIAILSDGNEVQDVRKIEEKSWIQDRNSFNRLNDAVNDVILTLNKSPTDLELQHIVHDLNAATMRFWRKIHVMHPGR